MGREERNWHKAFVEYTKFIARHEAYRGMPSPYKDDGSVRWVVTGNSELGKQRLAWWDRKRESLGLPKGNKWPSEVARAIHPTGEKPCQICGRVLKISYVYPNRNCIKKLNSEFKLEEPLIFENLFEINEIAKLLLNHFERGPVLVGLSKVFEIPPDIAKTIESYLNYILENRKSRLSPGAMSDCPDRFDGFHTYNKCCRSVQDTGRHRDNLQRYGEDRRVYESWSDGNWKAAAWLMQKINGVKSGVCSICGKRGRVTADHIGPVSLGFSVGNPPILRPACRSCNSSRNNRMTLSDISRICGMEKDGISVVSWHSGYIWDALKNLPESDDDAKKVSRLMRLNLHYVLTILGKVAEAGHTDYLIERFLHPEFAYYSYDFEDFDPITGNYSRLLTTRGNRTEYERNANRYIRIALASLKKYLLKDNRKIPSDRFSDIDKLTKPILRQLESKDFDGATVTLNGVLVVLSKWALNDYDEHKRKTSSLDDFF